MFKMDSIALSVIILLLLFVYWLFKMGKESGAFIEPEHTSPSHI
jgi:hypothetical protein